jgi:glucosamine kinase
MLLIADSGTSKTDWILTAPGTESLVFKTPGLNPFFLSEKEMIKLLNQHAQDMFAFAEVVEELYFFGAGCSNPDRREVVSNALSQFFPRSFISVDSDLQGSVFATCGNNAGLCCILGTGSNIAFYDGENIQNSNHGLGYILGDEGSGSSIGKRLITDFLYGNMPSAIHAKFEKLYGLTKESVIRNMYLKSGANFFLASFAKFLTKIRESEYAQTVIRESLTEFIITHIKASPQHRDTVCHFVGSVAYVFERELRECCDQYGIMVGKVIHKPIYELEKYILNQQES